MDLEIVCDCLEADWKTVAETLRRVGMSYFAPEVHRRAFEASDTVVFAYRERRLIGFGRALSDGEYQAAVYDVAVVPEFQRQGIGRIIMQKILERTAGCNVILYASPGKEGFYRSLGLRKMRTGMALFRDAEKMGDGVFTD